MSDAPPDPILDLRGIRVAGAAPYDCALEVPRFTLAAGELAAVEVERGVHRSPLADVSCGLLAAGEGTAVFENRDWSGASPNAAARARFRIGRVFDRSGYHWLSNLDIDENLTLGTRFHHGATGAEVHARIEALARAAGCWPVPEGRPATVQRALLRRLEWVRAFLNDPVLLVLENPLHDVEGGAAVDFTALVEGARRRGAAVLWMAGAGEPWHDAVRPSSRWSLAGGRLAAMEMK